MMKVCYVCGAPAVALIQSGPVCDYHSRLAMSNPALNRPDRSSIEDRLDPLDPLLQTSSYYPEPFVGGGGDFAGGGASGSWDSGSSDSGGGDSGGGGGE